MPRRTGACVRPRSEARCASHHFWAAWCILNSRVTVGIATAAEAAVASASAPPTATIDAISSAAARIRTKPSEAVCPETRQRAMGALTCRGRRMRRPPWRVHAPAAWEPHAAPRTPLVVVDHPVDEGVGCRLIGLEEAVALHVGVDLLEALPGVLGVDLIDPPADVEDLLGVDRDVGGLALEAGRGLVDEDPAVGQ